MVYYTYIDNEKSGDLQNFTGVKNTEQLCFAKGIAASGLRHIDTNEVIIIFNDKNIRCVVGNPNEDSDRIKFKTTIKDVEISFEIEESYMNENDPAVSLFNYWNILYPLSKHIYNLGYIIGEILFYHIGIKRGDANGIDKH